MRMGVHSSLRLLRGDLKQQFRRRVDLLNPICFFVLVTVLFPLSFGSDIVLLNKTAGGVIWIALLFSVLMPMEHLFEQDKQQGVLLTYFHTGTSLGWIVFLRFLSHWLISVMPLLLIAPILSLGFHLSCSELGVLMLSLFLGSGLLVLLGGMVSVMTLSLRRSGLLFALLVLPLVMPVLIFGVGAVVRFQLGFDPWGSLLLLSGFYILALILVPWATAGLLRVGVWYDIN